MTQSRDGQCVGPLGGRTLIGLSIGLLAWLTLMSGNARADEYSFGVLSQRSAVLTAQYWNPILDYVEKRTGTRLTLKVARTAPESNDATARGEYDFVYSNTIFLPKMAESNYQVILRPRDEAIRGQIVTLADSPIQDLADLAGSEVGFPSLAAFVGYAVPMDRLMREGIEVTPVFGGNQEGIMGQLKAGRVIAAGVNSQVMRSFATREGIQYRVLWESDPYNNLPIAAHPRVPEAVIDAVRTSIAGMAEDPEGARILQTVGGIIGQKPPYGFLASSPEDYRNYVDFYASTLVQDIR
ncbi:MAG: phosphate/phosphite/phosphonate ABC transporter substrate-binding protein [Sphingobacteriia bacterium]|nr:phosphate/phosphite/phosphonate ABC transporter substrate-binding protein [Sphingobacteriia bacterium]NCC38398.1 phosphate/phosphite/phosphonate ABC transporter substrate-binding protein [Gammaproteobacteria bacterium]